MNYTYTEPITDRSQTDIENRTAKAFFNLSDWERIYQNALYVNRVFHLLLNMNVQFDELPTPTMTNIPDADDFNTLIANINRICAVMNLGLPLQKADYYGAETFTYENVNQWETMLADMLDLARGISSHLVYSGVSNSGQGRFFQARWRSYQWVTQTTETPSGAEICNLSGCGVSRVQRRRWRHYQVVDEPALLLENDAFLLLENGAYLILG